MSKLAQKLNWLRDRADQVRERMGWRALLGQVKVTEEPMYWVDLPNGEHVKLWCKRACVLDAAKATLISGRLVIPHKPDSLGKIWCLEDYPAGTVVAPSKIIAPLSYGIIPYVKIDNLQDSKPFEPMVISDDTNFFMSMVVDNPGEVPPDEVLDDMLG